MRIFVCEFLTGGGMRAEPLPGEAVAEALLLRTVLVHDLESVPGLSVTVAQDDRLGAGDGIMAAVGEGVDPRAAWRALSADADLVWPLSRDASRTAALVGAFRACGRRVIGHRAEALELLSAPDRLTAALTAAGIPADPNARGDALSLSVLARSDGLAVLALHHRHLAPDGRLAAMTIGAAAERSGPFASLALSVVRAVPGLSGLFDIDICRTPDGPCVTAISPGLALSYVGLHKSLGVNPVAFLPDFIRNGRPPQMPHLPQPVAIELKLRA
ncbi:MULTISPECIES: hypothetical protein [Azorhizobium]|uniref:hypothetical protein n=1 Tax=Azorhizobium TaxID=6 RepID=UPI00105F8643|nr:hypothetical protein [Azorhizobium sp. AG788]TDT94829.1 putative ATP-grasp superfamily ATP-dependent carboligase [Azorhizobium sp. AG788]